MLREKTDMPSSARQYKPSSGRSTALRSRVINLTEQMVIEEAEAILATCNDPIYQKLFAVSSERQRLIRYAMNRVGNVYVVESSPQMMAQHRARMAEQKPDIHKALYEGMGLLADVHRDGVYR